MKATKTITLTTNQLAIIKCALMSYVRDDEEEIGNIQSKDRLSSIDTANIEAINSDISKLKDIIEVLNG